ncbi:hypothetical protein [Thiocystis minor]|uniref:hypothetical protein n=1 Tax=Thiocystis minor TaxID=61597 RepID=UPI0019133AFB|nr:hypothetical protein [Thiocystis minor]
MSKLHKSISEYLWNRCRWLSLSLSLSLSLVIVVTNVINAVSIFPHLMVLVSERCPHSKADPRAISNKRRRSVSAPWPLPSARFKGRRRGPKPLVPRVAIDAFHTLVGF